MKETIHVDDNGFEYIQVVHGSRFGRIYLNANPEEGKFLRPKDRHPPPAIPKQVDTVYPHLDRAMGELGQTEYSGWESNPRIREYVLYAFPDREFRYDTDEVPWCAAFVCWCLQDIVQIRTGLARGVIPALDEEHALHGTPITDPNLLEPGDIVLEWRGDPSSYKGHISIMTQHGTLISGNKFNAVSIVELDKTRFVSGARLAYSEFRKVHS